MTKNNPRLWGEGSVVLVLAEREGFEPSPEYFDCQIIKILKSKNYTKYV
jgi:hypothetical protein